ncbi:MAG: metal-dependent hydrolase [Planctomycetes bacterium]|nr:metal-dependent hydrolase [Planctomycetota bacterium]
MANFYGHFTTSAVLAAGYGAAGAWYGHFDWGVVALASGLTTIGGLTPDLDSDNSTPVRELFALAGAVFPLFLIPRLRRMGLTLEEGLAIMIGAYLFIRYGLSYVLKRVSVHRGMFHSIPALIISGLAVYNVYHNDDRRLRLYMAGGMMLGFLSHLILDEIFAVDLRGLPRFKSSFGTALKLTSSSWRATMFCYSLLFLLGSMAWLEDRDDSRKANHHVAIRRQLQLKERW